ncbi:hypothetical protein [Pontibacillus yanchengensis]|uniref:Uncharacterized protein n=1 Tax=Pontibacillus yanchengensis Y32 TaxID=1385514 RepID=A0A0A2TDX5_9BACI|nr:hypothetical protein [Pontibacillus yanchengensis]KGP74042.1 hypothetical protein N782_19110 [Pontibacillus yanchengensis Y32]
MVGTALWNLIFACFGGLLTFFLSQSTNTISTTMIRSTLVFVLFFLVMFVLRWILQFINKAHNVEEDSLVPKNEKGNANQKNQNVEEELSHPQDGEENKREDFSDDEAKQTSEMIRELLKNDDR